jgi:hypothetical protein
MPFPANRAAGAASTRGAIRPLTLEATAPALAGTVAVAAVGAGALSGDAWSSTAEDAGDFAEPVTTYVGTDGLVSTMSGGGATITNVVVGGWQRVTLISNPSQSGAYAKSVTWRIDGAIQSQNYSVPTGTTTRLPNPYEQKPLMVTGGNSINFEFYWNEGSPRPHHRLHDPLLQRRHLVIGPVTSVRRSQTNRSLLHERLQETGARHVLRRNNDI